MYLFQARAADTDEQETRPSLFGLIVELVLMSKCRARIGQL